jgi:dihydroorotase
MNDLPAQALSIRRPDDFHLHLRDGATLAAVLPFSARVFARAIVMPNLRLPVATVEQAQAYRARILDAAAACGVAAAGFEPLMTLYLTAATTPAQVDRARASGIVHGVKLYPARATTHSDAGLASLDECGAVLERMQETGLPLLVHGEVARREVDVFDRERIFIDEVLAPLRRRYPGLKIVLEHVTTREAVQFVREAGGPTAATITAHHLLFNRNAMFLDAGGAAGMRPHFYCVPVLKREGHRRALVEAATSGDPRFFLGTDSAPHPRGDKEAACGCAGCFTAPLALPLYAQAFEQAGALDRLDDFAGGFGADFYGLPRNAGTLELVRRPPAALPPILAQGQEFVALGAGTCTWSVAASPPPGGTGPG